MNDPVPTLPAVPFKVVVPEDSTPVRVDAFLGTLFPGMGVRGRRRLWTWCRVSVNGRSARPGTLVRPGDIVAFAPLDPSRVGGGSRSAQAASLAATDPEHMQKKGGGAVFVPAFSEHAAQDGGQGAEAPGACRVKPGPVRLAAISVHYAALCKPSGLHTTRLSGRPGTTLEGLLPKVLSGLGEEPDAVRGPVPQENAGQTPGNAPDADCSQPDRPDGSDGAEGADGAESGEPGCGAEGTTAFLPGFSASLWTRGAPVLLTRLDLPTSGLVLAARSAKSAARFRELEAGGRVRKTYFVLLAGRLEIPLALRCRLNTRNRARTRVERHDDPDPARHTLVRPLCFFPGQEGHGSGFTLALAGIRRGARHQIRAHLAAAGYPLAGDSLYDGNVAEPESTCRESVGIWLEPGISLPAPVLRPALLLCPEQPDFYLHHALLRFAGFTACSLPSWPFLPARVAERLLCLIPIPA